jgi:phosphoribosyl 1,2-cyclic phosphate phosphodiesterase
MPFGVADFEVTPIEANHAHDRGAVNYILSRGTRSLLIAFDTGWYGERSWAALNGRKFDVVIMECTNGLFDDPDAEHLSVDGVKRMHAQLSGRGCLNVETLFVTVHFSHNGGLLHEELEGRLARFGIIVGYDGLVVEIPERG